MKPAKAVWNLRLFAKWVVCKLHLAGLLNLIEYCEVCGIRQPLVWYADDDLWLRVTGNPGGVLCPTCFDARAQEVLGRGVVRWTPTWEGADRG